MDRNKRLAELLGICWHDLVPNDWPHNSLLPIKHFRCANCDIYTNKCEADINPDFAGDPRLVLREMMKRDDFQLFMARLMYGDDYVEAIDWDHNIDIDYILDTTGKLRDAAIEWMKREALRGEEVKDVK